MEICLAEIVDSHRNNLTRVIEIRDGVKVEVRDFVYEELKKNKYIQGNFQMNTKRLNR